jgi:hypothetical protein
MLKSPDPPEEKKRPGTGFFVVLGLATIIMLAIVWVSTAH